VPDDAGNQTRVRRSKLVIADWGPTAELLIFPPEEPVDTGASFHYRGSIWVITGRRRDSRILVAEPVTN
jgi:hypothetical protein